MIRSGILEVQKGPIGWYIFVKRGRLNKKLAKREICRSFYLHPIKKMIFSKKYRCYFVL